MNRAPLTEQSSDGARRSSWQSHFIAALLVALVALWPAVLNGGPFWMADTPSYFRAADSAVAEVVGVRTAWTAEYDRVYRGEGSARQPLSPAAKQVAPAPDNEIPVTLKGRSIFYGFLLHAGYLAGSLWLVVLAQSLLATLCITLTVAVIYRATGRSPKFMAITLIGVAIAITTPLGFFANYLMPDIFGALALLALMNLLFLWGHSTRPARGFFIVVLAFALLAHSLNLLLALLLVTAAVLWRFFDRNGPMVRGLAAGGACIVMGFAGQAAFDRSVAHFTGAPPVRPPFIAMRLIADGPGQAYLRENCLAEPYLYCRFKNRADLHSDTLLWSKDPARSLFRGLPPGEQRLSADQENDFVLAVAADRPVEVLRTIVTDSLLQTLQFNLDEFNYYDGARARLAEAVPPPLHAGITPTSAYLETMPVRPSEIASALTALAAVVAVGGLLVLDRRRLPRELRNACLFILFAVALNAALAGALSGPKGRYQMRLIWVLPLVAAGVIVSRPQRDTAHS